jgi:hypothetical protein
MTTQERNQTQLEAQAQAKAQYENIVGMVELLAHAQAHSGDCAIDAARDAILESPLSVQVRSGWVSPGANMEAFEFEILLSTGGPACRIIGTLNLNNEPRRASLEYQGWGTPWKKYFGANPRRDRDTHDALQETLLAYCREFYFWS